MTTYPQLDLGWARYYRNQRLTCFQACGVANSPLIEIADDISNASVY